MTSSGKRGYCGYMYLSTSKTYILPVDIHMIMEHRSGRSPPIYHPGIIIITIITAVFKTKNTKKKSHLYNFLPLFKNFHFLNNSCSSFDHFSSFIQYHSRLLRFWSFW